MYKQPLMHRAAFQGQAQLLVTEVDASSEQQPSRHSRHALARVLQALQAAADSMETSVGLSLHLLNVTVLAASEPWRRLAACVPSCKTINGRGGVLTTWCRHSWKGGTALSPCAGVQQTCVCACDKSMR